MEWLVISDGELKGLMNYSRCNRVKRKQSDIFINVISEAYQQLRSLNMKEEAIFLFLTYLLCLSSKCLLFMTAGSIIQNSILKYWDPAEQYKEINIISSQVKKLIESYEVDMKFQNSSGIYD